MALAIVSIVDPACEAANAFGCRKGLLIGCTEIRLLLRSGDFSVPMIDEIAVHAEAVFSAARLTGPGGFHAW